MGSNRARTARRKRNYNLIIQHSVFITFEGIDGSGKSTQIRLLREKLEEAGNRVEVFREPGGTALSEEIRRLLLDFDGDIHAVSELLLFSAARAQLMSEQVMPLLEGGSVVILDRFYDSTTAYQGYGRGSASLEQISRLNRLASLGREPDLTIYLRIGLEEAKKRTAGQQKDRMERSGDSFFKKVIRGFDQLADSEERIFTVDATLPRDRVHGLIYDRISSGFDGT